MEELSRREVRELARLTEHLADKQQVFFQGAYWRLRRNPTTALVLCLLLGNFGAHYFYFGRYRDAVVRLLFCWTLLPWVVALFDARTITSQAVRYNTSLAGELLLTLQGTGEEAPANAGMVTPAASREIMRGDLVSPGAEARVGASQTATTRPRAAEIVGMGAIAAALAGIAQRSETAADGQPGATYTPATTRQDGNVHENLVIAAAWQGREEQRDATDAVATDSDPTAQLPLPASGTHAQEWASPRPEAARQTVPLAPLDALMAADPRPASVSAPETHSQVDWQPLEAGEEDALAADSASHGALTSDDGDMARPTEAYQGVTAALQRAAAVWDRDAASTEDAGGLQAESLTGDEDAVPALGWPTSTFVLAAPSAGGAPTGELEPETAGDDEDWYAALPGPSRETAAEEQAPVFMYQMETLARRDSVWLGPPPLEPGDDSPAMSFGERGWVESSEAGHSPDQEVPHLPPNIGGGAPDISLLGPALASGLADLLRERPARTRPRTADEGALAADAPLFAPLAPLSQPQSGPTRADEAADGAAIGSPWEPAWEEPSLFGATLDDDDLPPLLPMVVPQQLQQAINGIRESTSMAPTAAYVTTPSQPLRRRVVQRVIVRKMAVLDGRVVAESTVERQVQVVDDDEEMAERIREATNQAAREALEHLIAQAPEEALPAIRMQLYALDNASSVSNFQGNGVLTGPRH
jgi:TM2 domain-containing membrane protein YozV